MGLRKIKNTLIILITALLLSAVSLAIIGNVGKKENDNSSAANIITAIYDFDDLKAFRDSVNMSFPNDYLGVKVYLYADINMNNESWNPIGTGSGFGFQGYFYGNGHTIYNYAGQYGIFVNAAYGIYDLNVIANNAGQGIVNEFNSFFDTTEIRNCTMRGTINASEDCVGGIAGLIRNGCVVSCQNFATINGNGKSDIGGIAGASVPNNWSRIIACINYGNVSGVNNVGGVVGQMRDTLLGTVQTLNSINLGKVSGTGEYIGGIVGRNRSNSGQLYRCYNASSSGVKGAGVGGSKVGKDFTEDDLYCFTTSEINSAAGGRR